MSGSEFQTHLEELRTVVEVALRAELNRAGWPASLKEAVEYSLMAGGKRLRPVLVLLANDVCGGKQENAIAAACAIEMIHTYSLIHDDLPSMDDDDFRRGRPTNHKVFGEASAILAGDCLLTQAFQTISSTDTDPGCIAESVRILAVAAGGCGMVGGQVLDLAACDLRSTDSDENDSHQTAETRVVELTRIHRMKTGALIVAALDLGAVSASADLECRARLRQYGNCIGLAFQIADDLLDVTGEQTRLGKTPGRDVDLGKLTYPGLLGIEPSRARAQQLVQDAHDAVDAFGECSVWLKELAGFIVERDH